MNACTQIYRCYRFLKKVLLKLKDEEVLLPTRPAAQTLVVRAGCALPKKSHKSAHKSDESENRKD